MKKNRDSTSKKLRKDVISLDELLGDPEFRRKQRESVEKAKEYNKDWHERVRANSSQYAANIGIDVNDESPFVERSGQVTIKWELELRDWLTFTIHSGKNRFDIKFEKSWKGIGDKVQADHFERHLEQVLFATALRLAQASAIFANQTVSRSNPMKWRKRFLKRLTADWQEWTGDTMRGRKKGAIKNSLKYKSEREQLAARVIMAVKDLFNGSVRCVEHVGRPCVGHDAAEITRTLVSHYLREGAGEVFGNKLCRLKLRFRQLKKEALAEVTK